jgi:hypothetical protein
MVHSAELSGVSHTPIREVSVEESQARDVCRARRRRGGSAWTGPFWNDELAKLQYDYLFASDALLLGRVTYEGFAAAWP